MLADMLTAERLTPHLISDYHDMVNHAMDLE